VDGALLRKASPSADRRRLLGGAQGRTRRARARRTVRCGGGPGLRSVLATSQT